MKPPKPNPCKECPFRRDSMKGYLGAWEGPEEFIMYAHYLPVLDGVTQVLPCHSEVDYRDPEWKTKQMNKRMCTGQAVYLSNSCTSPRDPAVHRLPADHVKFFSNMREFIAHHTRKLTRR